MAQLPSFLLRDYPQRAAPSRPPVASVASNVARQGFKLPKRRGVTVMDVIAAQNARPQGELKSYAPSLGEKLQAKLADGLGAIGLGNFEANRLAGRTMGAFNDLTPVGNVTGMDDGARQFRGGVTRGDLAGAGLGAGVFALSALPVPGAAKRVGKGMFGRMLSNEDGAIRAYHGTSSEFDQFGRIDGGNANGAGYYFTTNPEEASRYATGEGQNRIAPQGNAWPNVRPVELDVSNPFDGAAQADRQMLLRLAEAHNKVAPGTWGRGEIFEHFDRPAKARDVLQYLTYNPDEQGAILQAAGFDARLGGYGPNDVLVWDANKIKPKFGR